MKIYLNGQTQEKESLQEILEPGFLFGWGVFEVLCAYGFKPAFLDLHTQRLNKSLSILGIEPPKIDWHKEIEGLLSENNLVDAYIRITAYKKRKGTGLIIYVDRFAYYGADTYKQGFKAIISPHRRDEKDQLSKLKSLSYLQNRISWLGAQKNKKDEALVLNTKGFIAGGARSNLFLIKQGKVFTPSLESGAFEGITREVIIRIAKEQGLKIEETDIGRDIIFECSEAFITSSLLEVMPLVECDGSPIGKGKPGEITLKLLSEYRKLLG